MWTIFWDMHSGGGSKEPFNLIFIEAPKKEAEIIFYNRFGHNPHRVTCTCCGEDYVIDESETFEKVSDYHRERKKVTLGNFKKDSDVKIITSTEIKDFERVGELPQQGYIWQD